jgi:hypothetical protein
VIMAGGLNGFYEHSGGSWHSVAIDRVLHAEVVESVASTPQGVIWITASRTPVTRLYQLAGLIAMVLLALNIIWFRKAR